MRFEPELTLDVALERYFRLSGITPTNPEAFIPVRFGPFTMPFPNTESRRKVLPLHDLHHVATEFPTTLQGECEIGAYELAAGCGSSVPAWFYNLGSFSLGALYCPRKLVRAFARGRRARSLYLQPELKNVRTVGELRSALRVQPEAGFRLRDLPALVGLLAVAILYGVTWPAAYLVLCARALAARPPSERAC
jgi:hypothetical protein